MTTTPTTPNVDVNNIPFGTVRVSPFCLGRQIGVSKTEGPYGGWTKAAHELENLCELRLGLAKEGNRPYARTLTLTGDDAKGFITTFAMVGPNTNVHIRNESRRPNEAQTPVQYCRGVRSDATRVDIIMYSKEQMIADGDEVNPEGDWQIVSINCQNGDRPEPQNPWSMLKNWFSSDKDDARGVGGSPYPADKDPKQFISELYDSLKYWSFRARIEV